MSRQVTPVLTPIGHQVGFAREIEGAAAGWDVSGSPRKALTVLTFDPGVLTPRRPSTPTSAPVPVQHRFEAQKLIFYVYIIFRLNGVPCYVGKGKGDRYAHHRRYGSGNKQLRYLYADVDRAGQELPIVFAREGLGEKDAYATEDAFIAAIGRADLGLGPLFNVSGGVAHLKAAAKQAAVERAAARRAAAGRAAAAKAERKSAERIRDAKREAQPHLPPPVVKWPESERPTERLLL